MKLEALVQLITVLNSFDSSRSLGGDHIDLYEIDISSVKVSELRNKEIGNTEWKRGDELEGVLEEAVDFVTDFSVLHKVGWFPKYEELKTEKYFVHPWSITLYGERPNSAKIIFVKPSENKVFYVSASI